MNFLLSQVLALFLASFFRSFLHPTKVSSGIRHIFGLSIGLCLCYFCFGQQAIHIAGLPALCYIVIRTQNPQIVQRYNYRRAIYPFRLKLNLTVLSVWFWSFQCCICPAFIFNEFSTTMDQLQWTLLGSIEWLELSKFIAKEIFLRIFNFRPLMIITQKVTTLAFSIHDGVYRNEAELSKSQQYHAVRKLPSALEYFAYVLHFQGLMAGPLVFYRDYIEFIEGSHILKHTPSSNVSTSSVY